jgi:hypothetical protein
VCGPAVGRLTPRAPSSSKLARLDRLLRHLHVRAKIFKRAPECHSPQRHGAEDPDHQDQGHADPYHA